MNQKEVTKLMDIISWLSENYGIIGGAIIIIIKFAQDHLRINNLEKEMGMLKENAQTLIRIEEKINSILAQVDENKGDIKNMHRQYKW